jgi:hypothetical protein
VGFDFYEGEYGVDWDVVFDGSGEGCVVPSTASPKLQCQGANPGSKCDCTQNDYIYNLDYSGGGTIMSAAVIAVLEEEALSVGIKREEEVMRYIYNEAPVVGIGGQVIARNVEEMIEMGEKYKKFDHNSDSDQIYLERKDIKNILGERVVQKYNELLKAEMIKKGRAENRDFSVNSKDGTIEFEGYKYGYQSKE